ncbi:hypothetical protein [Aliiglaciecola sp. NS0011-25]
MLQPREIHPVVGGFSPEVGWKNLDIGLSLGEIPWSKGHATCG